MPKPPRRKAVDRFRARVTGRMRFLDEQDATRQDIDPTTYADAGAEQQADYVRGLLAKGKAQLASTTLPGETRSHILAELAEEAKDARRAQQTARGMRASIPILDRLGSAIDALETLLAQERHATPRAMPRGRASREEPVRLARNDLDAVSLPRSADFGALRASLSRIIEANRGTDWMDAVDEAVGQRVFHDALTGAGQHNVDLEFIQRTIEKLRARSLREPDHRRRQEFGRAMLMLGALYSNASKERANAFLNEERDFRRRVFESVSDVHARVKTVSSARGLTEADLKDLDVEVASVQKQIDQFRQEQKRLKNLPGLKVDRDELSETSARLTELEGLRKQLNDARRGQQKRIEKETTAKATADAAAKKRRGETVDSYAQLQDRHEEALKILRPTSKASQEEREEAEAFLNAFSENKKKLAKMDTLRSEIEAEKRDLARLQKEYPHLEGTERGALRSRMDHLKQRITRQEELLASGRHDVQPLDHALGLTRGLRRTLFGAKAAGRRLRFNTDGAATSLGKHLHRFSALPAVSSATETVNDRLKVAGHAWLWNAQASRYRAQEEAGTRAQRTAKSSLWAWWYRFSRPVRQVVVLSLTMAPLMVPVGILQIGGWGLLVLGGFVLNALVTFGLEVVNLAYYGVMSLFNLVGSFLSGAADLVGASLVGSLGVCPNGIADPACAYQSLHYHFGVSILRAPPLIDPRLLFPTHFNNNALLSVALDLMGHLDPVVVASFIGLAALGIPLFLMTGSSIGLRVLVGLLVGLLGIPAVMTQAGLMGNVFDLQQLNDAGQIVVTHRSFYAYAADLFRTGVGNVFTRPAMALAQQALDAVLHAQDGLASFSGGPAA